MVHLNSKTFILFFGCLLAKSAYCVDESKRGSSWVSDFFADGISTVSAEYTVNFEKPMNASEHYYKQAYHTIHYNFSEKRYDYTFDYEYREAWNNLVSPERNYPEKQEPFFTGSKITTWTNDNGLGIYKERYERHLPNWFVFDNLDSLFILHEYMGNPLPSLSGVFFSDELKVLKKLFKENDSQSLGLWSCFDFDSNGNLVEISKNYLQSMNVEDHLKRKKGDDYSIVIRNRKDQVMFVEIMSSLVYPLFMEGIVLKYGEKKVRIFSFEINALFHKFIPDLVANPDELIWTYLTELKNETDKSLSRFEETAHK